MARKKTVSKVEATAFHEAGHAFIAATRRLPFHHVTIEPGEDSAGHILRNGWPKSFDPEFDVSRRTLGRIEDFLFMIRAGRIAQYLRTDKYDNAGAYSDFQSAADIGLYLHPDGEVLSAYMAFVDAALRSNLRSPRNWVCVEAIAKTLLAEKTIKAKRIRELIVSARADYMDPLGRKARRA